MILRPSVLGVAATTLLCFSSLTSALSASDIPADTPVSQLIQKATVNLAAGNSQDALLYFDVAIQKDPRNYLTLFKRGAAYLSIGKTAQASRDFDQVLVLKPGFEGALVQRAKIKSRSADWTGARKDYLDAGKTVDGQELAELLEAEGAAKLSADAENAKDWEACVTQAGTAIVVAGAALDLRQRRARCRFEKGEVMEGIADLHHVVQISPGSATAMDSHMRISAMTFYALAETEKGLSAIAKCLQNDPDNRACAALRKSQKAIDRTIKRVDKLFEKRQYATAVKLLVPAQPHSSGDASADDEPGLLAEIQADVDEYRTKGYIHPRAPSDLHTKFLERTCEAYHEMNNVKKSQHYCDLVLDANPTSLPALLSKATRQIAADEFEPAIATLTLASDTHGNSAHPSLQQLLQKARTLLKRSQTKDYYAVLGLTRDASASEIKRAFRKLTVQHHPDKAAKNGVSQEEAQKKMSAINEAYEVLSDEELKERFDRGEDPNDPRSGNGGNPFQGSPFGQQMFFQQGGGGGGFKFQAGAGAGGFQFPGGFPFG